ncbi:MAG: hypothetical protein IMW99_00695 [Firmicutes bacterium]|nr:hypothetical protein [Bacillota bacterium]
MPAERRWRQIGAVLYLSLLLAGGVAALRWAHHVWQEWTLTAVAREGVWRDQVQAEILLVGQPLRLLAPQTGQVTYLVQAEQRVAAGQLVASLRPDGSGSDPVALRAPSAGIVRPASGAGLGPDGRWDKLWWDNDNLQDVQRRLYPGLRTTGGLPFRDGRVRAGEIVLELWDPFATVLWADVSEPPRSPADWPARFRLQESAVSRGGTAGMKASQVLVQMRRWRWVDAHRVRVELEWAELPSTTFRLQAFPGRLVFREARGILVPSSSLAWEGRQQGLWQLSRGRVRFVPVRTLLVGAEQSVVEGVSEGARVLLYPASRRIFPPDRE